MGPYPLVGMDEPEHKRLRSLVAQAFRQRMLAHWDEDLVVPGRRRDDRQVRRPRLGRARQRVHLPLSGAGDRRDPRPLARGPRVLPPACARGHQRRGAPGRRASPRAPSCATTSPTCVDERRANPGTDLISELVQAELDGEHARRRGDLLVPPPAAPGRRGDDVPRDRQLPLRPPDPPRPVRGAAQADRSLMTAGDRGVDPLGGPAAHHVAGVRARHRARRRRRSRRARASSPTSAPRTTTRPGGRTATSSTSSASRSRTSRSASACTCASGCTWPAWRWRAR